VRSIVLYSHTYHIAILTAMLAVVFFFLINTVGYELLSTLEHAAHS